MRRAAALVTDSRRHDLSRGDRLRELGVPCVVGTRDATRSCATASSSRSTAARRRCSRAPSPAPAVADGRDAPAVGAARRPSPPRGSREPPEPSQAERSPRCRRRRRAAARRVHDPRGAGRHAPARCCSSRAGREEFVERMAAALTAFATRLRARDRSCTGRSTSARTSSAGSRAASASSREEANPMIGYPRLLPLRPRAGSVPARARGARARAGRRTPQPARDDPVRAHAWELEACLELIATAAARPARASSCG